MKAVIQLLNPIFGGRIYPIYCHKENETLPYAVYTSRFEYSSNRGNCAGPTTQLITVRAITDSFTEIESIRNDVLSAIESSSILTLNLDSSEDVFEETSKLFGHDFNLSLLF